MDTEYRIARFSDSVSLVDFMKAVSGDTDNLAFTVSEAEKLDENGERLFVTELRKTPSVFAVAITDGIIAGTCEIRASDYHVRTKHRGELAIAVRKEYWGTGIAQRLLDFALAEAYEKGIRKVVLSVRKDNERAIAFYRKNNFFEEGCDSMLFSIDGEYVDGLRFGLVLNN
ncbi:MAG: GNAT family N-acetyltransferase [Spirochaetes bacterium]|uniref:GNAT family N-acetyltransferase n=1 Tax=Candidatus Ornithospirochaeta stercoripullorum TaxID=2840899 RepID=A0A9D9H655_9SPIO|nr:GNAT family N-acetyltransferase [Candidatus Ornithospirochaeta stercoripullorum]